MKKFWEHFDRPEPDPMAGPEVTLTGRIEKETGMAVLFVTQERQVWLPKALIAIVHDVGKVKVTLPSWFARKKGLR